MNFIDVFKFLFSPFFFLFEIFSKRPEKTAENINTEKLIQSNEKLAENIQKNEQLAVKKLADENEKYKKNVEDLAAQKQKNAENILDETDSDPKKLAEKINAEYDFKK